MAASVNPLAGYRRSKRDMTPSPPALRRALGTALLVLYGLGVIIGAGIYVLIGSVVEVAGTNALWSFIVAGALAGLTGLSYAELAVRMPEAAGAAAYTKEAFRSDRLSQLVGLAVAAVVIVSTATIARGSVGYLQVFVSWPAPVIAGLVVIVFTFVACLDVRESVGLAAAMAAIEIGGLVLVVVAGVPAFGSLPDRLGDFIPEREVWTGVMSGAYLAFFAFVGFENLANMAEEAREPERSLPRAILISLLLSTLLYVVVTVVLVLALRPDEIAGSTAPLLLVAQKAAWFSSDLFAAIALIAVANGVLLQLVMLGRLLFGMSRRGWLPAGLGQVHTKWQTPVRATMLGGVFVLAFTVTLPFVSLVAATSTMTLLVFAVVNLALWQLQRVNPRSRGFRVPRAIPLVAMVANVGFAIVELVI
jgi:basic amino acid/polyamine antiporter, APA family